MENNREDTCNQVVSGLCVNMEAQKRVEGNVKLGHEKKDKK